MAFEQNLYKNRANKKSIIIAIFDLITIDKDNYIGNHDKPSLQNQLMRVLIDILQKALDYAINYQKQNNQKISFLKLGCFIDI